MNTVLCILTLNEFESLQITLPQVIHVNEQMQCSRICAIDGGSTDGTVEFFQKNDIEVLIQNKKGRGEAFKLALNSIEADGFIFFSPDGNENYNDIPILAKHLDEGADLVIASRMMKGAANEEDDQIWRPRKYANLILNFMANLFFNRSGRYITDSINGFRAITRKAGQLLDLSASDYTIEYQMSIRAMKARLNIVEFPTIEGQRVAGESGIASFPAGLRFMRRLFLEIKNFRRI
ncbi:MAG: glycosyltransferase [Bdellovibrionaceae bacterium]|nr:glycosyltransferase [Bdellovibrio sp.]